jgi:hypothetical protein
MTRRGRRSQILRKYEEAWRSERDGERRRIVIANEREGELTPISMESQEYSTATQDDVEMVYYE